MKYLLILALVCLAFSQEKKATALDKGKTFTADQDYIMMTKPMANEISNKMDTLDVLKKKDVLNVSIIDEYKKITFRDSVQFSLLEQKIALKDSIAAQYQGIIKAYDDYCKATQENMFTKYKFWFGAATGIIIVTGALVYKKY